MITPEIPRVVLDGRYSTKEAAALLGIDRSTLNRHVRAEKIRFGRRRSNGRKFFYGKDILTYWRATL